MTPAQYLDAVKERQLLSSDYALAKKLGFRKQLVSKWRAGTQSPDAYACAVLAVELGLDPASVIADVQAQAETNDQRREFWRGFLARASKQAAALMLAALCIISCASVPPVGGFRRRYGVA